MAHHYTDSSGLVYPSVTTVIRDRLQEDFSFFGHAMKKQGKNPETELKRLGHIGTICHYRVLNPLSVSPLPRPDIPKNEKPKGVRKYGDLCCMMWDALELKVKSATCEKFGVSSDLKYCGTYDLHANITGEIQDRRGGGTIRLDNSSVLLDIKTAKEAKESHFIQLGGYSLLIDKPIDYGIIVCLCPYIEKNQYLVPKCYVLDYKLLMEYRKMFIELVNEWWMINGFEQRRALNV